MRREETLDDPGAESIVVGLTPGPSIFVADCVPIDLDGAWPGHCVESAVDCREWGPRLRYCARARDIEEFHEFIRPQLGRFTLFGSGDFHHLTALWLRQFTEPVTLVSFDNHPDWDTRPPRWGCGTWLNRALELPSVRRAAIWGCGNWELNWPNHLFINRQALREQRLEVWPWTERLKPSGRRHFPGMTRADWREKFLAFARGIVGDDVYVTVDLDCLDREDSATNWEQGLFRVADLEWALEQLRAHTNVVGGDVCGAYSPPKFARWNQRLYAALDHPRLGPVNRAAAQVRNTRALEGIWRALTDTRCGETAGAYPRQSLGL